MPGFCITPPDVSAQMPELKLDNPMPKAKSDDFTKADQAVDPQTAKLPSLKRDVGTRRVPVSDDAKKADQPQLPKTMDDLMKMVQQLQGQATQLQGQMQQLQGQGQAQPQQPAAPAQSAETSAPAQQAPAAPQNTSLAECCQKNGLQSNQDLINHCYKNGGGSWDGAQQIARQMGVDLNDLVKNRQGGINTTERPVMQGPAGQAAAQNGLYTNQDMINHCYKNGGGTWDGAQQFAQNMGLDLNQLVQDRQGTIRPPQGGQTTPGAAPSTGTGTPTQTTPGQATPGQATPGQATPGQGTPANGQPVQGPQQTGPAPASGQGVERILNVARNELALGVRENAGSNEDREGNIRRYRNAVTAPGYARNRGPEAWCADFVSHVFKEAGNPLGPQGKGFASVAMMRNWLRQSGKFHTSNPQPGDIAFFRDFSHVAIIESVNRDGTVTTIEGNTSPNGGGQQGLHRKTRRLSGISGFGRP